MRVNMQDMTDTEMLWKNLMSTHFNICYNKSKHYEPTVTLLTALYGTEYEKEIRSVVTNVVRMLKIGALCVKIPRNRALYTNNKQSISYKKMMSLLDLLEGDGYIDLFIGGVSSYGFTGEPSGFDLSITEVKGKFVSLFDKECVKLTKLYDTLDTVQIKQRKTKLLMTNQGVKGVKAIKDKVSQFNAALIEARISLKGVTLPNQKYKRMFIENLTTGGRWYNATGGVQTMDKTLRPFLQIDGEDLIELDYSAIHPNLLYEQMQADLPKDFDPYGVDLWELHVDPNQVDQFQMKHGKVNYDPARNLIKMAVMIGLNSSSVGQAAKALAQSFGKDTAKWGTVDEHKSKYLGLFEIDWKGVMFMVQEHNSLIADKFFSDVGVELQYIDSEILDDVICSTLAIDEVLLCWHDGVMVKKQIANQVKEFMYKAWYKQFGSINFCKVDEK